MRRDRRPCRGPRALLAVAAFAGLVATAAAETRVGGIYDVRFANVPVGRGEVSLVLDGEAYSAKVSVKPVGVGQMIAIGRTKADSAGWIRDLKVVPARYRLESEDMAVDSRIRMALTEGRVASVDAEPPLKPLPDRVPVKAADLAGIVDPLSATLMPVADPDAEPGKAACNRDLPIFDGWTRYDVRLSYKTTRTVETKGYKATAVVCQARWKPVSGHRPGRQAVQDLKDNREIEAWLVPVPGTSVLLPFRISLGTPAGPLVVEALDLKISGPDLSRAP
ncbi:DUF3108 domain-containing protein [Segnochrobactraceae bacterium EtOH-i3]